MSAGTEALWLACTMRSDSRPFLPVRGPIGRSGGGSYIDGFNIICAAVASF
jgi:hypothetical protein